MSRRLASACVLAVLACAACDRERRDYLQVAPGYAPLDAIQMSTLEAGLPTASASVAAYQENRWAVSQGQMLFTQFNCAGCHSPGGGGGMGPPLTDDEWIYGSEPENIFATIVEGRPNGMPSWRGKIANPQVWQLAAYVRSLGGLTPKDTWPARADHMQQTTPDRDPTTQQRPPQ
jgi:cytochrome c oxidase cbb3-type subunit III